MTALVELTVAQCEALVRGGVFGRFALVTPDGVRIVPVNYAIHDDAIVVRVAPASTLARHAPGTEVAFELDYVDYAYRQGWSVQLRGVPELVDDSAELEQISRVWEPQPWAPGDRPLHLRMAWAEISGRQIGAHWDPLATMPVRRNMGPPGAAR